MDNEGLLEWAEYEVNKAQAVLKRAEMNRDERRKAVDEEREEKVYDMKALISKVCNFIDQETARMARRSESKTVYDVSKDWMRHEVTEDEPNAV
jgi:hypothetical protein